MKTIARIFLAVILVQQCGFAISKENNKLLSSQQKDKKRSTLPINVNNNFIYQFPTEKRTLINAYDSLAFPKQDQNGSKQFHVSIEKRKSAISSKIQHEITHRKLKTTRRNPQNTQRSLLEKNAFLKKLSKLKSHNYAARNLINLFNRQILGSAETNGISRETSKELNRNNIKSKRSVKILAYDRKFKFESPPTQLNESKLENNLSSKISFKPPLQVVFYYNMFKPREVKENFALSNGAELQIKNTFLPPTILTTLHKALLVHPFKIWKLEHKFSSMKDIRVHENKLHEVIQNPWNQRLQHKLYKVLRGEDVYLDVFGGSNTVGAGPKKDEGDIEGRFSKVITHWWNKTITPITGSNLKLREIAMGGTSSEFFQFCFGSYIHEKLDLVFIEMAVNDMRELPSNANRSLPLEQLTRQLLAYPTEPALVYINLFEGLYCNEGCTNIEDYGQNLLTDTYNITSLKWRNAVCFGNARNKLKSPCELICSDKLHINQLGHAHISLMVINLFRKIVLDHISSVITNSRVTNWKKPTRVSGVNESMRVHRGITFSTRNQFLRGLLRHKIALPRPLFIGKTTKIISEPLCWTNLTPNYHRINDVKNNLNVVRTKNKGFYLENAKIGGKCNKPPCRVDAYRSWTGKTVGANITFSFTVLGGNSSTSAGGIQTRSVAVAIRTCWNCGAADMWLDSCYKSKKIFSAKLHYGRTTTKIVALHVEPGNHTLNVEVVREGKVSIVAIMVGPSDGPY
ncbi:Hypothetical predicted protein [Paramuricea clavata]|uniref:Uncharacterized protein n=1 Tax=Paramuricea clavata TaxID=317549 RepID=A0A6S7IZ59_PARCT|nr:Hypothetical predicted protein [Paramuricea clavata]